MMAMLVLMALLSDRRPENGGESDDYDDDDDDDDVYYIDDDDDVEDSGDDDNNSECQTPRPNDTSAPGHLGPRTPRPRRVGPNFETPRLKQKTSRRKQN